MLRAREEKKGHSNMNGKVKIKRSYVLPKLGVKEVFLSKLKSCPMSFGDYKDKLDSDSALSNLKGYSLKVGFETIPNGRFVLKTGLTKG